MTQFSVKKIASLRFVSNNSTLREEIFKEFGSDVYNKNAVDRLENWLLNYFTQQNEEEETSEENETEISITSLPKKTQKIIKQLLDIPSWQRDLELMNNAKLIAEQFGDGLFTNFNDFEEKFDNAAKKKGIKLSAKDKKDITYAITWTDPNAEPVIKKKHKDGSIEYVSDPALKDYENIPLKEDIQTFFEREVIPFASDAWWDKDETRIGYEINFNKYFYQYIPPRNKEEIAADMFALEEETENLLKEIMG
jgi:type I restriction enzyme M protein